MTFASLSLSVVTLNLIMQKKERKMTFTMLPGLINKQFTVSLTDIFYIIE